jgi:hypothetical protein
MAKKKVEVPKNKVTKEVKMGDENKKVNITEPKLAQKNEQSPTGFPEVRELFARKKDYGVVSMTEQASTRADETAKQRISKTTGNLPPRLGNCIHKIRED